MEHSARQFIIRRPGNRTQVVAGYPWHGVSARQAFISLPGLTLAQNHKEDCIDVLDTYIRSMQDGMFTGDASAAVSVDAPLWFFWTLQKLEKELGAKKIWKEYGHVMKQLLESYRRGIDNKVILNENGLLWASSFEAALTWMNSHINGKAVTPRNGYQVEVNALWYNAVCYTLALAADNGDKEFVAQWESLPAKTAQSFNALFKLPEGHLADYIGAHGADASIRPNMIIACALPYKMIDIETQLEVIRTVHQHLLTPKGLRSLSPRNPLYKGSQEGSPEERDLAAKNGAVWPWLHQFYIEACFDIDGDAFLPQAREALAAYDEDIQSHGIGSISELYDADPPYLPKGAISSAWSVGSVLAIQQMIQERTPASEKVTGKSTAKKSCAPAKTTTRKCAAKRTTKSADAKSAPKRTTKKAEK